jgi:hypothetical protein
MAKPAATADSVPQMRRRDAVRRRPAGNGAMTATMRLPAGDYPLYIAVGAAWAPFGGPRDEDIFLTFGIAPRVFFGRLLKIVNHHEAALAISLEARTRIAQCCTRRLCSASKKSASARAHRPTGVRHIARPSQDPVASRRVVQRDSSREGNRLEEDCDPNLYQPSICLLF